ncbi:MAG TPA: hypothetical protein VGQ82_09865, partial [Chthoniobacterales bacterium]|nr:hypothetical protein [Chthoniobacterales bacterium]
SGHWLYSFLRFDPRIRQRFLAVVNLNPSATLKDVRVILDEEALAFLDLASIDPTTSLVLTDRLAAREPLTATFLLREASDSGIRIEDIPPLTPLYLEFNAESPGTLA